MRPSLSQPLRQHGFVLAELTVSLVTVVVLASLGFIVFCKVCESAETAVGLSRILKPSQQEQRQRPHWRLRAELCPRSETAKRGGAGDSGNAP